MSSPIFNEIAAFFDDLVTAYGDDPRASDWSGAASQRLRFNVLADVTELDGCSVLDVGCGVAGFGDYLRDRCPSARYTGIDLSPKAVETARRERPYLDVRVGNLLDADLTGSYDVVIANGILYRLGSGAPALAYALVMRLWELADRAVAFSSLSAWSPEQSEGEYYADPVEMLDFCRTLTPCVTLRHDYAPHDFTVYLYREVRA